MPLGHAPGPPPAATGPRQAQLVQLVQAGGAARAALQHARDIRVVRRGSAYTLSMGATEGGCQAGDLLDSFVQAWLKAQQYWLARSLYRPDRAARPTIISVGSHSNVLSCTLCAFLFLLRLMGNAQLGKPRRSQKEAEIKQRKRRASMLSIGA